MLNGIFYLFIYINRFRGDGVALGSGSIALIIIIWRNTWELFQRPMMQLGE